MGRDHLGNVTVDVRIILKWILEKHDVGCGLDLADPGWVPAEGFVYTVMNIPL
jgi:hypothetical protein